MLVPVGQDVFRLRTFFVGNPLMMYYYCSLSKISGNVAMALWSCRGGSKNTHGHHPEKTSQAVPVENMATCEASREQKKG